MTLFLVSSGTVAAGQVIQLENKAYSGLERHKELQRPERRIAEQKRKIERLQESILEHKMKILHSREKERTMRKELTAIEGRLQQQRQKLAELRQRQESKKEQYDGKLTEMQQAIVQRDTYRHHVQQRLAAFYRMGSIGIINVTFSAARLPDLLTFQENFQHLMQYDRGVIRTFQETISRLASAKEELGREQQQLTSLVDEVKSEEEQLAATLQTQEALLELVNTEHQLYQQAVAQIEKAAGDLGRSLRQLQEEAVRMQAARPATARKDTAGPPTATMAKPKADFLRRRGQLPPPVVGTLAASYGDGIDIRVSQNADVRAVADGGVILAAFLKKHGNMLVLDHGEQYYTILSRLGELRVSEGTQVGAGQVIATAPPAQDGESPILHFEIRHGSDLEDPLQWLDQTQFDTPPAAAALKVQ